MNDILDATTEFIKNLPIVYDALSFLPDTARTLTAMGICVGLGIFTVKWVSWAIMIFKSIIDGEDRLANIPRKPYKEKKKGKYER